MLQKWTKNQLYEFCTGLENRGYKRIDDDNGWEFIWTNGVKTVSIIPTEAGYDIITG